MRWPGGQCWPGEAVTWGATVTLGRLISALCGRITAVQPANSIAVSITIVVRIMSRLLVQSERLGGRAPWGRDRHRGIIADG